MTVVAGTEELEEEGMSNLREAIEVMWRFSVILGRRALWRALKEAAETLARQEGEDEGEHPFHQQFEEVLANIDEELELLKTQEARSGGPAQTGSPYRGTGRENQMEEEDFAGDELDEKGFQLNKIWEKQEFGSVLDYSDEEEDEEETYGEEDSVAVQTLFLGAVKHVLDADSRQVVLDRNAHRPSTDARGEKHQTLQPPRAVREQEGAHFNQQETDRAPLLANTALSVTDLLLPYLEKVGTRYVLQGRVSWGPWSRLTTTRVVISCAAVVPWVSFFHEYMRTLGRPVDDLQRTCAPAT